MYGRDLSPRFRLVIDTVFSEVRTEAEETVDVFSKVRTEAEETVDVFSKVRTEAEETVEHQTRLAFKGYRL
jgi:hypothetical protein